MPFAISQVEVTNRMSQNVMANLAYHHKYELGNVGTIYYVQHENRWEFVPSTQLEQAVHRVGQKQKL